MLIVAKRAHFCGRANTIGPSMISGMTGKMMASTKLSPPVWARLSDDWTNSAPFHTAA